MRLPDLIFLLDGYPFKLSPKHYILKQGLLCKDLVRGFNENYFLLGAPFLRAYYTLFDMEYFRIGLARSVNYAYSASTTYYQRRAANYSLPPRESMWDIAAGVLTLVVMYKFVCWCLCCGDQKKT